MNQLNINGLKNLELPVTKQNGTPVMCSVDLSKVCNVRHDNFIAKVPTVLGEKDALKFKGIYSDKYKRPQTCFYLPKRESCLMAMSYSYELQAQIYDEWSLQDNHSTTDTAINLDALPVAAMAIPQLNNIAIELGQCEEQYQPWIKATVENMTGLNLADIPVTTEIPALDPPLPTGQKRACTKRIHTREKSIYNLKDFLSIREFSEMTGLSLGKTRKILIQHNLIKLTHRYSQPNASKYVMDEQGWNFGLMYDPSTEKFHDQKSKQLLTSNCQPVFQESVIRFFDKNWT